MKPAPPDHVLRIQAYNPGKPQELLLRELNVPRIIKMDSNENAFGPSPAAVSAIKLAAEQTHRYPEGGGYALRNALSSKMNLAPDNIILGNGSTELVEILARTYLTSQHNTVTADQTFTMYRTATVAMGAECRLVPVSQFTFDLDAILDAIDESTRIVFIANPNNPTGTIVRKRELQMFLQKAPALALIVLDEAYLEYAEDPEFPNGADYLAEYSNLVVLRTFSKIHGLAGMRIGFGMAHPEVVADLNRIRSPFNTSAPAEAGAIAALQDEEHVKRSRDLNRRERQFLEQELARMQIPFVPSCTNFLFLPIPDAEEVARKLLQKGIVVRPMRAFNQTAGLRVTVGAHEDNLAFLSALR
jgi:histidinol-phosphate aminotransferase